MAPFPTLVLLTALLMWSIYTDEFLDKGRLLTSLLLTGIYLISIFVLTPNRLDRQFLFLWVLGLVGLLLFSFAWGLDAAKALPYWPSSLFFLLVALFSLASNLQSDLLTRSLLQLHLAVLVLFASLITDGHLGYSIYFTVLIYVPLAGYFLSLFLFKRQKSSLSKLLDMLLVSCFYILAARKWAGMSNVFWILIVQPFVGLLFLDMLGERGRLISLSAVNKRI